MPGVFNSRVEYIHHPLGTRRIAKRYSQSVAKHRSFRCTERRSSTILVGPLHSGVFSVVPMGCRAAACIKSHAFRRSRFVPIVHLRKCVLRSGCCLAFIILHGRIANSLNIRGLNRGLVRIVQRRYSTMAHLPNLLQCLLKPRKKRDILHKLF